MTVDAGESEEYDKSPVNLGHSAAKGGLYTGIGQLARVLLQLLSVVVLARLLDARDYGLVAMVLSIIGVAEIFREFGLSGAVIQARTLSRAQRDNLFWFSAGAGLLMTLVVAAASPLVALVFAERTLVPITLALAPTFFLSGVTAPYRAQLTRQMRFGAIAANDIISGSAALGSGIAVALFGFGYWALVAQQLVSGLLSLILFVAVSRWFASRYRRDVLVRPFLKMGGTLLLTQVLRYVTTNMDAVLIGARYGPVQLGYFNRGLQLIRTPTNILRGPVGNVSLPVIARLQSEPERLMRFAGRAQVLASFPILIILGWFVASADAVVRIALGDQWLAATSIMQLIAMAEGVNTLTAIVATILIGTGQARGLISISVFSVILKLVALLIALPFGVEAVVLASVIVQLVSMPLVFYYGRALTGLPLQHLLYQSAVILTVSGCATLVSWVLVQVLLTLPDALEICVAGAVLFACLLIFAVVPGVRRDYAMLLETGKRAFARRAIGES